MALTKCRECGKDVSTEAKACPNCGASAPAKKKGMSKPLKYLLILFAIGIFANVLLPKRDKAVTQSVASTAPSTSKAVPPISPTDVREIAAPQSREILVKSSSGISTGTLADAVLAKRGKATFTNQVGKDANGLLVEWQYPDETYLMARQLQDGIEAYRVVKITQR